MCTCMYVHVCIDACMHACMHAGSALKRVCRSLAVHTLTQNRPQALDIPTAEGLGIEGVACDNVEGGPNP